MNCPMMGMISCRKETCAWWSDGNQCCAIKAIADNGGICCQSHGEYDDLLSSAKDGEDAFLKAMKDFAPAHSVSLDEAAQLFKKTGEH